MMAIRHLPFTILIVVINVGLFILGNFVIPVYPLIGVGLSAFLTAYIFNHILINIFQRRSMTIILASWGKNQSRNMW